MCGEATVRRSLRSQSVRSEPGAVRGAEMRGSRAAVYLHSAVHTVPRKGSSNDSIFASDNVLTRYVKYFLNITVDEAHAAALLTHCTAPQKRKSSFLLLLPHMCVISGTILHISLSSLLIMSVPVNCLTPI